jgi:hypothetical protein
VKIRTFVFGVVGGALALPGWGVEPPLPGEDGPAPASEVFKPLLEPGDALPPESEAPPSPDEPPLLPPLFPEGMPGGGNDGVDGLPTADGDLLPPEAIIPGEPPLLPAPNLEPAIPGFELAARAFWHSSPREAREVAKREKKPLLIFFYQKWKGVPGGPAGAAVGDNNVALNDDLLSTSEFNEFAAGRVVLTRLFYPISYKGVSEERKAALQQFRDYFKVKSLPTILLLDENGREIARIKGYSRITAGPGIELSAADKLLEKLKRAVELREQATAAAEANRKTLLAQNYREWTSKAGTKLFAKLVSASADEVILRDETGALRQVLPEQLWIVDIAWIRREAKKEAMVSRQ